MQDIQTNGTTNPAGKSLPLEPLLVLLRSNGFVVKPDDYVEFLKVIEKFGTDKIEDAALLLCPLLATTGEEQTKFYKVFEQYVELNKPQTESTIRKKRPWLLYGLSFLFLSMIVYLLWPIIFPPRPTLSASIGDNRKAAVGDTVYFEFGNSGRLRQASDTSKLKVTWDFGNGWTASQLKTFHMFSHPGKFLVVQKLETAHYDVQKELDSIYVNVCNVVPKIDFNVDSVVSLRKGDTLRVAPTVTVPKKHPYSVSWQLVDENNQREIATTRKEKFEHRFNSAGDFTLKFTALVGNNGDDCNEERDIAIQVTDQSQYALHVAQTAANFIVPRSPGTLLTWGLLIPGLLGLGGGLWARNYLKKGKQKESNLARKDKPETVGTGLKPPFEVPFQNNDTKLVWLEPKDREMMRSLRQKMDDELMLLNIPQTIKGTIRSGGFPGAIFTPQLKPLEYLVLIDRSNPKSMITALFDYLVRSWDEEGITVERLYYNKGFEKFYNAQYPTGISLRRLVELYKSSTLIIAGDARDLVYSAYPVINKDLLDEFNEWEQKAVITPVCFADWGEKEKEIARHYLLLPADIDGQLPLLAAMREKILNQKAYLQSQGDRFYEVEWYDFRSVAEIKNYLNQDEALFQWLCSICIYPKIRWEFFVESGKAILERYGQAEKVNYTNLLRLCRIPWMKEGVFPENTRLELLKELKVENEVLARETLLRLYKFADDFYKGDNFFAEEKDLQQISNEFVLYAHDKEKYALYQQHAEKFGELWANNKIPDTAFRKYIGGKSNGQWETPIDDTEVKSADNFIAKEKHKTKKAERPKYLIANAIAVLSCLMLVLFGLVQLSWKTIRNNIPPRWQSTFTRVDSSANVQVNFKVDNGLYCGDSIVDKSGSSFISTSVFDEEGNRLTTFGLQSSLSIPYSSINHKQLTAAVTYGRDSMLATHSFVPIGNVNLRVSHCVADTPKPQPPDSGKRIRTNACETNISKVLPATLNSVWNGSTNNRKITINTSKRTFIYSTGSINTFGTYRIEEACATRAGYRILLSGGGKYRVCYISSVSQNSFRFGICPEFFNSIYGADSAGASCASLDLMQRELADDPIARAKGFMDKREFEKAIAVYDTILLKNPKDAISFYNRALAYQNLGQKFYDKAIADYNSAIKLNSNDALSNYAIASIKYEQRLFRDAIVFYSRVIDINSKYARSIYINSFYFRGMCNYNLKNPSGACEDFAAGVKLGSKESQMAYDKYCNTSNNPVQQQTEGDATVAKRLFDKGDFKSALPLYDKLLQSAYPDAENYYYRGVCKFNLKDRSGACSDFQRGDKVGCKQCSDAIRKYCIEPKKY